MSSKGKALERRLPVSYSPYAGIEIHKSLSFFLSCFVSDPHINGARLVAKMQPLRRANQ